MPHLRRTLTVALTAALASAGLTVLPATANAAAPPAPAAYYPLGGDLVDAAGDYDGTAVGAVSWSDGLTLSGGSASGPYGRLPSSVVTDQGEDLTISTWVKREVPSGNYAALFFGTAAAGGVPANYWLLNPANPAGYAKSVFTNGTNTTQPWTTETGPSSAANSASAAALRSQWAQYTTVITADSIRAYLNGVPVGPAVAKSTTIGSFAGPLSVLIGKSNYTADATYTGSFRDLRVYNEPLDASQVAALYSADLTAPSASAAAVTASSTDDSVTVSWTAATGAGRAPVDGYRATLTEVGTGAVLSADVTGTSHTFRDLPQGSYTVSVRARNAAGVGPAAAATAAITTGAARTDAQWVAIAKAALQADPSFAGPVRGSLTLPDTLADLDASYGSDSVAIVWSSSNDAAITDTDAPSGSSTEGVADVVAQGAVTRGAGDTAVTLTATISRGSVTDTVAFPLTVLAAATDAADEAYLFAYFSGNTTGQQQIRFATTNGNDALDWNELNAGQPVLTSSQGTRGLRDPSIVRSVDGDTFYLLATDLDITKTTWPESYTNGSRYLEIWESTDLVNWSQQRHVEVSPGWAGMTWAPEAHWDESIGAYVVFWSSRVYPEGQPHVTGAAGTTDSRIVYATTRDFRTFSEPQVWVDSGDRIDATVIQEGDEYYRFTKEVSGNAGCQDIVTEKSSSLRATYLDYPSDGAWSVVENCVARGAGYAPIVEGPTVFAANPGDVNGPGYYLFADWFSGTGYQAFFTDDLAEPGWTYLNPATDPRVQLPASPRHGSVIAISKAEQQALFAAYQPQSLVGQVTATAGPRCVAGKVVLTVTAKNGNGLPVAVTTTSGFGSKSFPAVAPGANASTAFTTRAASIPAGTAAVTATATVAGHTATTSASAAYPALTCN